jgi:thioredoxin 1
MAGKVVDLTDGDFAATADSGVTLVDFWAPWCGPCRMQGPIVDAVAEKIDGQATVAKMNVDESPQTAAKFGIRSIPTIIVFKDGAPAQQFVGVQSEQQLVSAIESVL